MKKNISKWAMLVLEAMRRHTLLCFIVLLAYIIPFLFYVMVAEDSFFWKILYGAPILFWMVMYVLSFKIPR